MKKTVLGILAHVDAGKTTLSEGMLYLSGKTGGWEEWTIRTPTLIPMNWSGSAALLFFQAGGV